MSARCAKALIEGGPRRFFGSFLIAQKGTPVSPQNKKEAREFPGFSHKQKKETYSTATACCRTMYRGSSTSAEIQ